ncbi:ACP S-malonyltransferase [Rhodococcus daqingensis]|uniref:[acyl-carrier-protein] S-malonyltransferase n=1 Tax=Rhodococcus daqingensis TaxID=2479363 RepID=A0ABW2RW82_9NOCA
MTSTALLFPGQGAQRPGMLQHLPDSAESEDTLAEAADVLHRPVGPADVGAEPLDGVRAMTRDTVAIQRALLIAGTAVARTLVGRGYEPDYVAGHSAGAYAAAVVAGVLEFSDALRLISVRARLMSEMFPPVSGFGMLAVVGASERLVTELTEQIRLEGLAVYPSTVNAPDQITVSGSTAGLDRSTELAVEHGARRTTRLEVPVPAHSPLLASVGVALAHELDALDESGRLHRPKCPWMGNIGGRALRDPRQIADDLARGVALPVRWHDATTALYERGVRLFLEVSPGSALTRLAAAAFPDARAQSFDENGLASVMALVHRL